MKIFTILLLSLFLIACSNGEQKGQTDENKKPQKQVAQNLKQYSLDSDKDSDQDFDLIGTLIQEDDDQIMLKIKGKEIQIPKNKSFSVKDSQRDLTNQLVKVEVGSKSQEAEEMEPTAQAKADDDGIYEQEDDKTKIIGTFMKETDEDLTIKVKNGEKTYTKTNDFERDVQNAPKKLSGETVRIELQKDGKVKSLDYELEDQIKK